MKATLEIEGAMHDIHVHCRQITCTFIIHVSMPTSEMRMCRPQWENLRHSDASFPIHVTSHANMGYTHFIIRKGKNHGRFYFPVHVP